MTDQDTEKGLIGKIALVTGASRGIGRAVALAYARAGASLILLARNVKGLEQLDDEIQDITGTPATLVPLDLIDGNAIDRLGSMVYQKWGRLDIMVGNAAILGQLGPIGHIKPATWDKLMAVNVTANWRLIRAFDPLLRMSEAGRVIFTTSGVATNSRAYWGGYAASKAALEAIAKTYAAEVAHLAIKVNLVSPGRTTSAMHALAFPGQVAPAMPEDVAPLFVKLALPQMQETATVFRY